MKRNMDVILVSVVFLLEGSREAAAVSVKGVVGDEIRIKCSHTYASSNVKYFCKEACHHEDVLVNSQEEDDSKAKYRIKDEGNTFYVTISGLTLVDSGTYWCGIERVGVDTYTEVNLKVDEGSSDEVANASYSNRLVYIGAGLGLVVLVLAMTLLIFFKHRKRDTGTLSGKDGDTVYETVSIQKGNADIPTSAQQQETSGVPLDVIYSTVSSASQENNPFYSTISFRNLADGSTVTPEPATTTYSFLKHV